MLEHMELDSGAIKIINNDTGATLTIIADKGMFKIYSANGKVVIKSVSSTSNEIEISLERFNRF